MSSMLNNTIGTAKVLLEGVYAANGLVRMLRDFDLDDGLAWVGLARRTSPLRVVAGFSAGLVVGAGACLLFAPMSGAETRRALLKQFKALKHDAKEAFERAESEVKEVGEKAEEFAGKTKQALKDAEHKVENKVVEGVDALKGKAEAAADTVKDKVEAVGDALNEGEDTKSLIYQRGVRSGGEASSAGGSQTRPGNRHRVS